MVELKDLLGGEDNPAQAVGSVTDALGGLSKATKDLGEFFKKDLGSALSSVSKETERFQKRLDAAVKSGKISETEAKAALERQIAATERLNKVVAEESKSKVAGLATARKANAEAQRALKLMKEENKLLKSRLQGDRALLKGLKQQTRALTESVKFELRAGRINTGESKVVKGAGRVGQQLSKMLPGAGGIGPGSFGGGALDALSGANSWGAVTGAIMKVGSAIVNAQREAVISATQRIMSYGTETGSIEGDISTWNQAFLAASNAATTYNQDLEAIKSTVAKISTETGERVAAVGQNIDKLARLSFISKVPVEELGDALIQRMNIAGMSVGQAADEMERVVMVSQRVRKSAGATALDISDFYKGVQELSEGMDGLYVNQEGLAKVFGASLVVANKLGMSYTRGANAAKGLTRALTANYNESFATLEVYEDLQMAMKSTNQGGRIAAAAKEIMADLKRGFITQDKAARLLKEVGGTTDEAVVLARIQRAAEGGAVLPLIEARVGELNYDQIQVFKKIQEEMAKPGASFDAVVKALDPKEQAAFRATTEALAKKQLDPTKLANATLDQLLFGLADQFSSALKYVTDLLADIRKLLGILASPREALANTKQGVKDFVKSIFTSEEEQMTEMAKERLGTRLGALLGEKATTEMEADDLIKMLETNSSLLNKVKGLSEGEKKAITEVLGEKKATKIIQRIEANKASAKSGTVAPASTPVPSKVTMTGGSIGPDGVRRGSAVVEFEDRDAGKIAERTANQVGRTMAATGTQLPTQ